MRRFDAQRMHCEHRRNERRCAQTPPVIRDSAITSSALLIA